MIKYQEERSLLEVGEWQEQCHLERKQWTNEEYLKNLKEIATQLITQYHIELRSPTLSLTKPT